MPPDLCPHSFLLVSLESSRFMPPMFAPVFVLDLCTRFPQRIYASEFRRDFSRFSFTFPKCPIYLSLAQAGTRAAPGSSSQERSKSMQQAACGMRIPGFPPHVRHTSSVPARPQLPPKNMPPGCPRRAVEGPAPVCDVPAPTVPARPPSPARPPGRLGSPSPSRSNSKGPPHYSRAVRILWMKPKAAVRPRSRTPRRCGVPTQPPFPLPAAAYRPSPSTPLPRASDPGRPPPRTWTWSRRIRPCQDYPPWSTQSLSRSLSWSPSWSRTRSLSRSLSWTLHDPPCVHAEWPGLRWCLAPRRPGHYAWTLHTRFLRLDLADSCRSRFLRLAWIRLRWPSPDWLRRPRKRLRRPDHHQVCQVRRPDHHQESWSRRSWSRSR